MASLREHASTDVLKLLLVGDSSSGKTCALAALAEAGYKLRIADLDNGIPALKNLILSPKSPFKPHTADNIESIVTLTEKMRSVGGFPCPADATVFPKLVNLLANWKDGETNYGPITSWGPDTVLVLDSGSRLGDAAYNYMAKMGGYLGKDATGFEYQRLSGAAQSKVADILKTLYDSSVKCHVIVITHVVLTNTDGSAPKPDDGKEIRGYPNFIGSKSAPKYPQYFNNVLEVTRTSSTRRVIRTMPMGLLDLKNSSPMNTKKEYMQERGLAEFFRDVLGKDGPHVPA